MPDGKDAAADGDSRIALVTGANKGIGREVARQLARRGAIVLVGARDPERGRAACRELAAEGADAHFIRIDVTDEATIRDAAESIEADHGRLDILVNNAGILLELDVPLPSDVDSDCLRATYEVNAFGPIAVMRLMLPLVRRSRAGRIVNVSTALSSMSRLSRLHDPQLDLLAYNSSKAALNAATLLYARELLDTSIKVNLADPMHCATDINGSSGTRSPADGAEIVVQLATLPADGPTGTFVNLDGPVPW